MAAANRYDDAEALYQRCGKSGIRLPKVSLGFWHNFGGVDTYERSRAITHYAFDHGIHTLTLLTIMALRMEALKKLWDN